MERRMRANHQSLTLCVMDPQSDIGEKAKIPITPYNLGEERRQVLLLRRTWRSAKHLHPSIGAVGSVRSQTSSGGY